MTCTHEKPSGRFPTGQLTVIAGDPPVMLVGKDPNRRSILIKNRPGSNDHAFIGDSQRGCNPTSGFVLDIGESVTIYTGAAVFARGDANLTFLVEVGEVS